MRKLFSAGMSCKTGCQYCFSKWDSYHHLPQLRDYILHEKNSIIYPCCDGDFSNQEDLIESIKKIAENMDKVYVSISTKNFISNDALAALAQLNQNLLSENKGFVKLSISFSNISMINEMEPGSISYAARLSLARQIRETSILFAVTIKPVLPFVSSEEYCRIIDDFSIYTKYFLLGGLYLNPKSDFYTKYITADYLIQKRKVEWLPEQPEWDYIENVEQFQQIRKYAADKGVFLFDSDESLIEFCIK